MPTSLISVKRCLHYRGTVVQKRLAIGQGVKILELRVKIRKSTSSFKGNLPNSALQAVFVALPLTPK